MKYGAPRRALEQLISPVVNRLIRSNINPNILTTLGTGISVAAGVAYGVGQIRMGGALLLASGIFDMLDGRVARGGGRTTAFGAFYDSTLDRVADTALFLGIALFFMQGGLEPGLVLGGVAIAVIAMAASLTVSYARARAEGLGLDCKVGFAQRAERLLGLGVPSLFVGAGPRGLVLLTIVSILAALAVITVVQRIVHVYKITDGAATPESKVTGS